MTSASLLIVLLIGTVVGALTGLVVGGAMGALYLAIVAGFLGAVVADRPRPNDLVFLIVIGEDNVWLVSEHELPPLDDVPEH